MNQHTPKHCFRKDVEDETKLKIHDIAVSETQDEAKESCFGGDDSRGRVQHCRTERCKNCDINRSNILGEKETFMIFVFLLAKKSFLHITYIFCISVAENNEMDGENPFWVIIDVGGDRFQARR